MTPPQHAAADMPGPSSIAQSDPPSQRPEAGVLADNLEELADNKELLRKLVFEMRESVVLRVKDHKAGINRVRDSFKGCYAVDWILANVPAAKTRPDAVKICSEMLHLGLFAHWQHKVPFQDSQDLYVWQASANQGKVPSKNIMDNVSHLRTRVHDIEAKLQRQVDDVASVMAQNEKRVIELDWRVSVSEQHLVQLERTLHRSLAVQQAQIGILLCSAVALACAQTVLPFTGILLCLTIGAGVVLLSESRSLVKDFLHLSVDFESLGRAIASSLANSELAATLSTSSQADESDVEHRFGEVGQRATSFCNRFSAGLKRLTFTSGADASTCVSEEEDEDELERAFRRATTGNAVDLNPSFSAQAGTADPPTPSLSPRRQRNLTRRSTGSQPRWHRTRGQVKTVPLQLHQHPSRRGSARIASKFENGAERQGSVSAPLLPDLNAEPTLRPHSFPCISAHFRTSSFDRAQAAEHSHPPAAPRHRDFPADSNVLVRQPLGPVQLTSGAPHGHLLVNSRVVQTFEGPLFTGRVLLWVRGLPAAEQDTPLRDGEAWQSWLTVQGQFKQSVSVDQVVTGQHFWRPLRFVTSSSLLLQTIVTFIVRILTCLLHPFLAPSTTCEFGQSPYVYTPLAVSAQRIHVAKPNFEPHLHDSVSEDVRELAGQDLTSGGAESAPASPQQRQRYFGSLANRKKHTFEPGLVYTFHLWQSWVNIADCELSSALGRRCVDLPSLLDGQPLRFMALDQGKGCYLWNFEIWHRSQLPAAQAHQAAAFEDAVPYDSAQASDPSLAVSHTLSSDISSGRAPTTPPHASVQLPYALGSSQFSGYSTNSINAMGPVLRKRALAMPHTSMSHRAASEPVQFRAEVPRHQHSVSAHGVVEHNRPGASHAYATSQTLSSSAANHVSTLLSPPASCTSSCEPSVDPPSEVAPGFPYPLSPRTPLHDSQDITLSAMTARRSPRSTISGGVLSEWDETHGEAGSGLESVYQPSTRESFAGQRTMRHSEPANVVVGDRRRSGHERRQSITLRNMSPQASEEVTSSTEDYATRSDDANRARSAPGKAKRFVMRHLLKRAASKSMDKHPSSSYPPPEASALDVPREKLKARFQI